LDYFYKLAFYSEAGQKLNRENSGLSDLGHLFVNTYDDPKRLYKYELFI
jgi:hypothetical protein